jgi:enoyl-CoA hydratase
VKHLLVDAGELALGLTESLPPLGFVDLDACPRDARVGALPPFPIIGVGNPDHPIAAALDAVLEPPISAEALIENIARAPKAAAIAVQVLRGAEGLDVERALSWESMGYGLLQASAEHQAWLGARAPANNPAPRRVRLERRGDVLCVTLDRPHARNAIDRAMRDELFNAFAIAALDPELREVRLRAEGAAFSIGGELGEFGSTRDGASAHLIRARTLPALALARRREIVNVHIQGACIGAGLELAAFAGRVTASSDAWFQLPELAMGVIPGAGGCVSIPRRIGRQRAALLLLSGRRINAATALRWGLVDALL